MKKFITLIQFSLILAIAIANVNSEKERVSNTANYAFVTDLEHDKAYDEAGNNGYLNITTNIVSVNFNLGTNANEHQRRIKSFI